MPTATEDVASATSFADLGVSPDLIDVLDDNGITDPFPIQIMTIPNALAGADVTVMAATRGVVRALSAGSVVAEHERLPDAPSVDHWLEDHLWWWGNLRLLFAHAFPRGETR